MFSKKTNVVIKMQKINLIYLSQMYILLKIHTALYFRIFDIKK